MHSSRMRTARSSSYSGGLHQAPPGSRPPRDQATPQQTLMEQNQLADPPARHVEILPAMHAGIAPPARHAGIPPAMHAGIAPLMNRMTHRGVLVLLKFYWAPDIVEFVLGRFSHFNIAIAYSNSTFCGAWTPSFCEFTQNFRKTSTPQV